MHCPKIEAAVIAAFSAVGVGTVSYFVVRILKLAAVYVRPSRLHRYAHRGPTGNEPWAMVTGASAGVGRALVQELAGRGFNVVLHGRNRAKLSGVRSELQASFPGRTFRIVVADAEAVASKTEQQQQQQHGSNVEPSPVDFEAIRRDLDDIRLTVLINNAGGGTFDPVCQPLQEAGEASVTGNVSLNALFPWHLSRVLLPNLVRHAPSVVVNVSSMADSGLPLIATYGAGKAFLMCATRALRLEMAMMEEDAGAGAGVEVLGVRLSKVTGARDYTEAPSTFMPDAGTMARSILDRVGYDNGVVATYWAHALQDVVMGIIGALPQAVGDKVAITVMHKQREELDGPVKPVKQT